ncbi:hypothetical protein [Streptomyces sp. NBC_00212]|uniref:hypothetical protein n=1 Tax=Streptomyces sp. NBC_00212 TaxID=2975684 RepID=UPI002F907C6D
MTAPLITVEARELIEGDLINVGGSTVTVTGTEPCDLPGMIRLPVSYRPYDNETIRTERWTMPATTRLTPRLLLRTAHITCARCEPGSSGHDVQVDRVSEGRLRSWICARHLTPPGS